jgi:hypothetical protein
MNVRLRIVTILLMLSLSTAWVRGQGETNRFGIIEGFWYPELTCSLGVGWERIIFNWEQHQPTGPDDWYTLNVDDRWLQGADACNREVVALLKHTPAWATEGEAGVGVPDGLDLPLDDPNNYWAAFVRRAVSYYAPRGVNHYIIWNEPDISRETYGFEFAGTLDDYFLMLRTAYLVAKEADPAAVIHLAGTTYWHDVNEGRRPYMERLVERIVQDPDARANGYYFDVFSLHIYFRTDTVYDLVREMRSMLDRHGLTGQRIWINETNAAPTDDPQWMVNRPVFDLDLAHQAAFLVQAGALSIAAGADRIAAYKLYDQQLPAGAESFGLLNPASAQPRPAFYAWQMVATRFADVTAAEIGRSEAVDAVRLLHQNGQETLVLWARTEETASVNIVATGDKAYRIDASGTITIVRPQGGGYSVSLAPALCEDGQGCYLGGIPAILVQPAGTRSIQILNAVGQDDIVFGQENQR